MHRPASDCAPLTPDDLALVNRFSQIDSWLCCQDKSDETVRWDSLLILLCGIHGPVLGDGIAVSLLEIYKNQSPGLVNQYCKLADSELVPLILREPMQSILRAMELPTDDFRLQPSDGKPDFTNYQESFGYHPPKRANFWQRRAYAKRAATDQLRTIEAAYCVTMGYGVSVYRTSDSRTLWAALRFAQPGFNSPDDETTISGRRVLRDDDVDLGLIAREIIIDSLTERVSASDITDFQQLCYRQQLAQVQQGKVTTSFAR